MSPSRYRSLDASHILRTIRSIKRRIDVRFPTSGLGKVCGELEEVGEVAAEFTASLRRPIYPIRVLAWMLICLIIVLALAQFALLEDLSLTFASVGDLMEAIEAMLSELVLLGVAVLFLATAEGRIKRHRSLRALRELRSIAHVVDMHQLTKDPKDLLAGDFDEFEEGVEAMDRKNLAHYLDYCSEILSLTSKLAALYLEGFDDHVVIGAVNEIEGLTSGLMGKIWQKIMILDRMVPEP
jgi:hypothetical protein